MAQVNTFPFKTEAAKQKYLALYDNEAAKWPIQSETRMIDSQYGSTYVRISGPEYAPVIVLLPGKFTSCNMWIRNIEALSKNYRTYAVDTIDNYGRSLPVKPIASIHAYVGWMDDLFQQLKLQEINLVGQSFGGMLATQYALVHPERLKSLTLLAPAATVCKISPSMMWRAALSMLPHPYFTRVMFSWLFEGLLMEESFLKDSSSLDQHHATPHTTEETFSNQKYFERFIETIYTASRCYQPSIPVRPPLLTDKELQSITTPTLFLVGQQEQVYSANEAVKRIKENVPQAETAIIENCAHDLPITRADAVNRKIEHFIEALNQDKDTNENTETSNQLQ